MNQRKFQEASGLCTVDAASWFQFMISAMDEFKVSSPIAQAMFIAQIGHESLGFTRLVENLNYSPAGIQETFGKIRFPDELAQKLGRREGQPANQREIAKQAYGGRLGNSHVDDGWKFRGRGLIQITGQRNYQSCGIALGLDLLLVPQLLEQKEHAMRSSAWYWNSRNCNSTASDIVKTTELINGTAKAGLEDRKRRFEIACKALEVNISK